MQGRTTLVLAHRLSSVIGCDRILVLSGGRVVEEGSHAALLARNGIYAAMWAAGDPEADARQPHLGSRGQTRASEAGVPTSEAS